MKQAFTDKTLRNLLLEELSCWKGTPYLYFGNIKHQGTDCCMFILKIFQKLQMIKEVSINYIDRIWERYGTQEVLINQIEKLRETSIMPGYFLLNIIDKTFTTGDILAFTINSKVINHIAIYKENDIIVEATKLNGVHESNLNDKKQLLRMKYRFYKR